MKSLYHDFTSCQTKRYYMVNSHQIVSFPLYVWSNYNHFISDRELIVIGHIKATELSGKKSWEEVAFKVGYKSISPIETMMNKLEERELINRKSYNVDFTPLYDSCLALAEERELQLAPVKEKKTKETSPYIGLAFELKNEFDEINVYQIGKQMDTFSKKHPDLTAEQIGTCFTLAHRHSRIVSGNDFAFRDGLKPFVAENIAEGELLAFIAYLTSYQNVAKELHEPTYLNRFIMKNYVGWVDSGRPDKFVKKGQKEEITFD